MTFLKSNSNILTIMSIWFIGITTQVHATGFNEILDGAVINDLTYRASKYALLRDQNDKKIAFAALLPSAQVNADTTSRKSTFVDQTNRPTHNFKKKDIAINLSQILFDLQTYAQYESAGEQSRLALLVFQKSSSQLITNTLQLYTNLLMATDSLSFTLAEQDETQMRYRDVSQKVQAGIMTETDLAETQAQLERIKANVLSAEQNIIEAQEALTDTSGIQVREILALDSEKQFSDKPVPKLAEWLDHAQKRNLDIQIAKTNLAIAQSQEKASHASYYPTVTGHASINYHRNDYGTLINIPDENAQSIGVSLKYPLVSGGKRYYTDKMQSENTLYFKSILAKIEQDTNRSIRNLYHRLESGKQIIKANSQAVHFSKELIKMNKIKLQAGATTTLEVLDNISKLRLDQQSLAESRYQYLVNTIELKRLCGTLTKKDLEEVNQYFDLPRKINKPS